MEEKNGKPLEGNMRLVEISKLREHEQIYQSNFRKLKKEIEKSGLVVPIVVDGKTYVILDGHHRFSTIKSMGLKMIPAFLVDYSDPRILVFPRRKDIRVTKELVVKTGLAGRKFPPKTSRHVMDLESDIQIPIEELRE